MHLPVPRVRSHLDWLVEVLLEVRMSLCVVSVSVNEEAAIPRGSVTEPRTPPLGSLVGPDCGLRLHANFKRCWLLCSYLLLNCCLNSCLLNKLLSGCYLRGWLDLDGRIVFFLDSHLLWLLLIWLGLHLYHISRLFLNFKSRLVHFS